MSDCSRIRNHTLRAVVCVCLVLTAVPAGIASLSTIAVAQPGNQSVQVDVDPTKLPGNGTQSDPHKISNASELQAIEDDLGANYTLVNDIDASNTAHWNNGNGFDPIGGVDFRESTPPPFTGSFEGNNHTVTGLTIRRSSEVDVGLFGSNEGTIKNIRIRNATISGQLSVGGIAATSQGIVSNVNVSGTIDGSEQVGRVVGLNQGGTVTDAFAAGPITGSGDVGGLVGSNAGAIQNATASGSVNGNEFVGGLTGFNSGTIKNVTTSGNTTGSNFIGGLAGSNDGGTIRRATVSGDVVGSAGVGGIVGNNIGTIQNTTVSGSVSGNNAVGGLAGISDNSTVQNAAALSSVTGSRNVSGLVGLNGGTIRDAFAAGSISGENDTGGLVAFNTGTVENAYWDEQATGQSTSAGGAINLSTAQMQGRAARSNMSGLAFGATWQIQSNDYPALIQPVAERESSLGNLSIAGQGTEGEILKGTNTNVSVSITNVGEVTDNFTLTVDVANDTVNRSLSVSDVFTETTERIEFDELNTSELPARDDPFSIRIATEADTVTGNLTVLQPAQADLTNLSIEDQGPEPEIVNGEDKNISVDIKNSGDLPGNFSTLLTIGGEPVPPADEQAVELGSGEIRSVTFENATGQLDFSVFGGELPAKFDVNVSTVNNSISTNLTVNPQQANIAVQRQATDSSTIDPRLSASQTSSAIVVENVSANINSTIIVTNETDNETIRIAGVIDPQPPAELNGSNQFTVPLNTTTEFPGRHTVHVVPSDRVPVGSLPGSKVSSSVVDDAITSQSITLSSGVVNIQNQTVIGTTETVRIAQTDLQPASTSEYVIVLHDQSATDKLVGPAFGSSGTLTGIQSDVAISLNDEAQIDTTQNVVAMLHFPPNDPDSAFATAIPNADQTEGFAAGNIANRATVTVKQPAEANLTDLSIAGEGAGATLQESTDANVSVNITNIGEVTGNFTASLNIGSGEVTRSQDISVEPDNTAQLAFRDVTATLPAGNFDVTVSVANESISGNLTVSSPTPPASVTITDQVVSNGSSSLTVDSAQFGNQSVPGEAFVVVVHKTTVEGNIGAKIGESAVLANGTQQNIEVNVSQEIEQGDDIAALTTPQTVVAMLHRANTADSDGINHGTPITRNSSRITDRAQITIGDRELEIEPPSQIERGEPFAVEVLNTSGVAVSGVTVELSLGPETNNQINTTNAGGVAILEVPDDSSDEVVTITASPDGLPAYATGDQVTITGIRDPGDLQLSSLSVAPSEVTLNTSVTVAAKITNTGSTALNQTLTIAANETGVLTNRTVEIPGNTSRTVTLTPVLSTLGTQNILINDQLAGTVSVTEFTPPTAELSTLLLDGSPPPVEVAATSDVNVSLEITNNGDVSGQFTPSLSAGGISRTRTLELNASETQSIAFENVAANLRPRPTPYTLSVSTENETITGNLRIGDTDTGSLRITETRAPARVSDGDRFTVSVRVGNFGPNVTTDELALAVDKDRDGNFTGETVDTRQQTLVANGTAQIPFRATATGDEQLRFRVTTDNDTITGNISVVSTDYTTAVSTGDPHIVSFDGVAYDFQAAGEFILTREPTANGSLVVQARQEPLAGSDSITRNTAVATIVDNQTVIIDATDETPLQVNGSRVELSQSDTHAVGNGTITRNDNSLTITYPGTDNEATLGDEYLTVDLYGSRIDIELNLDPERDRPVEGVFGPADGNITNDISLPNGTALAQPPRAEQLYGVFRESWRVNNSTTLFGYEADNGPETYYNPRIPAEAVSIADLDQDTRTEAERLATEAGLQPGTTAFRNAVLDYALTDDSSYFTSAQQQNTSAETDRSVGTPTESTIRVESRSVGVGETAPVNLTLERAPEGLAGYNLTVSVSVADAEGINVTDATAPTIFNSSVTETTVGPENQTAEIRATDIKSAVQANATNTRLGSVIVAADTDTNVSTVDVTVSVSRIDDDTGDPIDVETQNGTVIVTQQPPLAPNLNAPTDLDGDGVFEDINGNGRLDFNDVVALFENLPNAEVPFQDINGNGRIDFDDIVELFKQI